MTGTLVNVGTVIAGGCLGSFLGDRLPQRLRDTVMQGIGLTVLVMGMTMALKTANILIVLGSILLGGLLGEWGQLQARLDQAGEWLRARTAAHPFFARGDVGRGFVTATLVFCVGPMAILGSVEEGVSGDHSILLVKSVLDGFSALAFAAALGMGVTLSALSVLLVQGSLTLAAVFLRRLLPDPLVLELTAVGGVILLGIGLLLLDVKRVRVASFLPALVIAPLLVALLHWLQGKGC